MADVPAWQLPCRVSARRRRAGRVCAVALALASGLSLGIGASVAADTSKRTIDVNGIERSYLISSPVAGEPRPLVIVLHGGGMSPDLARVTTGFEPLVDREGFVAVYPNALERRWNDGRQYHAGAGPWRPVASDDVTFIRALIAALVQDRVADPARVYVTGPSNGGMMTIRLVCEMADLLAAAAPIIASMPADLAPRCKPARAVPILVMNGTADPLVPYAGGMVNFLGGDRGEVLSTDKTMALFRSFNGCSDGSQVVQLAHRDPTDRSMVTTLSWTQCASGAPVVLYRVDGGGHRIPHRGNQAFPAMDRLLGLENRDFDGSAAIWSFFKDKRR